jgi:hypothetical protein
MARKTTFKFEGVDPSTGKKFKIHLDGWIPDSLLTVVKEQINIVLLGENLIPEQKPDKGFLDIDSLTIKQKIELVILQHFHHGWFNTNDVIDQYRIKFNETLKKTTAATNLQRLFRTEEVLERRGNRSQHEYRLLVEKVQDRLDKIADTIFIE